ncbi:S9 family peptidase [Anaerosalibacter bizertensis]|uniref:S9 family peptidase n=1 Tax=Anaerosalibacter bizertensis TaxID=932217 RepID=UPI001D013506|nr:S9 family peptidase [Anaerosalibacter bizertensis]MCB5558406.1 S9 family peptidase [Anaerosalibacter bizertensis]
MEKLQLDDFTKYKFLSSLKYSPNGEYAAFVLHRMDLEENKYLSNIWIYNTSTDKYFQLTSLDEEKSFIWLDESNILFPAMRNSKDKEKLESGEEFTIYYKINIHGGEAVEAFRVPLTVTELKKVDDKNFLVTALYDHYKPDINNLEGSEKEEAIKKFKEEKDYEVLDEIPFWSNGQGFTNKKRNRLYLYNKDENKIKPITDEFTDVEFIKLNKNRTMAIIIANSFKDKAPIKSNLYLYDINKNNLENITHEDPFAYVYGDFLNDKIIFAGNNMKTYGINENSHFYTMDLNNKKIEKITDDFDHSIWNSVGSDCRYGGSQSFKVDGDYLYFVTTEINSSYINRIDENGHIEKITTKSGSIDGFDIHNGNILFIGLKNMKLQELYTLENGEEKQITFFNEWVIKTKRLSTPERITFENEDGITLEGWIMKPVDFDPNKRYPGILDIHGGPKTVYGEVFYHEMQYWANEGYVVFFTNPRGSDGRGNEFADIRGKYGTIDYDDLMKFTDIVLEKYPFIDSNKIGVTGGSYGGFMTNWIIGHTDRFKAAASQRSISNWISKFGTTDIGYFFVDNEQVGTPWNNVEKLWFHSPVKYADKAKTPTLFIHSEEDYRCWLPEGLQMFTALKYHGVDARLCMFRGENHELSRSGKPKHRIRRLKEMTDWFDKYLK